MANRTDTQADTVHGGNPQYLVDRINRVKIYNDAYWKEFCFGLTAESLIDRAIEIDYVGGTYGGRRRPAKFFCLVLKCLQIQPDEDVVMEYIKQPEYKYLRALGCIYLRLTANPMTVYKTLEPLYADYRKLRYRDIMGKLSIIHMDEFVDWLLREETVCEVTMPGLPKREVLESSHDLEPRASVLDDDLEDLDELLEQEDAKEATAAGAAKAGVAASNAAATAANKAAPDAAAALAAESRRGGISPRARSASPAQSRRSSPQRRSRSARGARGRSPRARSPTPAKKDRRRGRTVPSRSASGARRRSRSHSARAKKEKRERERDDRREKDEKREKAEHKEKKDRKEKKAKQLEKWQVGYGKEDNRKGGNKADEQRAAGPKGKKEKDGTLSVEESNAMRKKLGLKPLRE